MKTVNTILLVGAMTLCIAFAFQATAGDKAPQSPKARQMQESLRTYPGEDVEMLDRSFKYASPKHLAHKESLRRAPVPEKNMLARDYSIGNARARAYNPYGTLTVEEPVYVAPTR